MSEKVGWNWDGKGFRVEDARGHDVAFVFADGDAYLRVPRLVAYAIRWFYCTPPGRWWFGL